jgi:hypothetical protein
VHADEFGLAIEPFDAVHDHPAARIAHADHVADADRADRRGAYEDEIAGAQRRRHRAGLLDPHADAGDPGDDHRDECHEREEEQQRAEDPPGTVRAAGWPGRGSGDHRRRTAHSVRASNAKLCVAPRPCAALSFCTVRVIS